MISPLAAKKKSEYGTGQTRSDQHLTAEAEGMTVFLQRLRVSFELKQQYLNNNQHDADVVFDNVVAR